MRFIIRHQFRDLVFHGGTIYYVTNFFKKFYKKLQENNPNHEFVVKNEESYSVHGNIGIFGCMHMSIINPDTGKYILISFLDDWKSHFYKHMGWRPESMVKFYYCGSFNYVDYFSFKQKKQNNSDVGFPENIKKTYSSFFYGPYFDSHYDELENIYNNRKTQTLIKKIKFRGFMWDHRKKMTDGLNSEEFIVIDKNVNNQSLNYFDFLKDTANYACTVSLPGNTNICNRDMECFGIGVPVLRPNIDVMVEEPLYPDYHYLSFYHAPKYWDGHCWYLDYKDFQNHLEYYWNTIKNNDELLNFVSENAHEWYQRNCSADRNIDYILSSINFDILK